MTKIKTAQAWGHRSSPSALLHHAGRESAMFNVPYVIVHGLTEAEVHEAAALLEKSREVCEWRLAHEDTEMETFYTPHIGSSGFAIEHKHHSKFCPSCGRRVKIK